MKKILVVGYSSWDYVDKLAKKYPDVLFFDLALIRNADKTQGIVELAKIVDGVLFTHNAGRDDRLTFEVAIAMVNKTGTYEESDFPLEESEDENGNAV